MHDPCVDAEHARQGRSEVTRASASWAWWLAASGDSGRPAGGDISDVASGNAPAAARVAALLDGGRSLGVRALSAGHPDHVDSAATRRGGAGHHDPRPGPSPRVASRPHEGSRPIRGRSSPARGAGERLVALRHRRRRQPPTDRHPVRRVERPRTPPASSSPRAGQDGAPSGGGASTCDLVRRGAH